MGVRFQPESIPYPWPHHDSLTLSPMQCVPSLPIESERGIDRTRQPSFEDSKGLGYSADVLPFGVLQHPALSLRYLTKISPIDIPSRSLLHLDYCRVVDGSSPTGAQTRYGCDWSAVCYCAGGALSSLNDRGGSSRGCHLRRREGDLSSEQS